MVRHVFSILLFVFVCLAFDRVNAQPKEALFTEEELLWIKEHPEIYFGYEPSWEPYEIYQNGAYEGIVGEYVKILAAKTGIDFRPIPNITWSESIKGLKEGSIKMVPCCAITPSRKKFLDFTEVYINDPLVIATRKDFEYVGELIDLEGKTVVVPENYYTGELIKSNYPKINLVEKESIEACLTALTYGEADAFIDNLGVVNYYIYHRGFTGIKIAAPTDFTENGIALAVTKDWTILRDIAQKVFDQITPAEKAAIRHKWISGEVNYGISWEKIMRWAILILVILSSLIVLLYYWNNTLRKNIKKRKEAQHQLMESLIEIKKQDNEKKVLLQEIHHRVKNNLQIVSSMMRLQADVTQDANAKKTLNEAVDRIKTIALIHDKIYKSPNLGKVCLEQYSSALIEAILANFSAANKIKCVIHANEVCIDLDYIVPYALILNELVTNSVKYAFENTDNPTITLKIEDQEGVVFMEYADNGVWKENPNSDNFGTSLIEIFTEQLEGSYSLEKAPEGTKYTFTLFSES